MHYTRPRMTLSGHTSAIIELVAIRRRKGSGRACAGVLASGSVYFDLDFIGLSSHTLNRRDLDIVTCWEKPRLPAAPNVARRCSCRRHPNTAMRTICVTAGNAKLAISFLKLSLVVRADADDAAPTSNDH